MSIIVTKSNGTSDITYTLQEAKGQQLNFGNQAQGLNEPELLTIQHWLRPLGQKGTDRHQVVFRKVVVDDVTGNTLVVSASLQLAIPRSDEVTLTVVKDLIAQLHCYLTGANVAALMNGATPEGDFHIDGPLVPAL
jgi:hypothetical protein